MAVNIEVLKSIPYYFDLGPDELGSIQGVVFEKKAERNELIILEGELSESLYFLASGAVKVFKTSAEGKEQVLYILRPGEPLNDVPVFDGSSNPASAQAMGPAVLYGMKKEDIESILHNCPQVALNAIKVLTERMRHLMSLVEDLSFRHVIHRVARILLEYAKDGTKDKPRLTQQEMATMAGTAREVVGRSLKTLEEEGAIRMERHRIVITDREALREMSR